VNVLIVEGSRFFRMSNERALSRAGYHVITAADGEEGLRLAQEHKPDLVILDLMLPKLPGREVLRASVMIVTSLPQSNDRKLLDEVATSYFEKAGLMLDRGRSVCADGHENAFAIQSCRRLIS
jgi:DNA-binding response OmpR family regulator